MRLSLWQSFSSNHSAPFTVVGVFASPEEVEAAAVRVRKFIAAMNRETPETQWFNEPDLQYGPPTAEDMLEWSAEVLERIPDELSPDYPYAVFSLDHLVFVDGSDSTGGAHPVDYLVRGLGATMLVQGTIGGIIEPSGHFTELMGAIRVDLTCRTPDDATAEAVEAELTSHLSGAVTAPAEQPAARRLRGFAYSGRLRREGRVLRLEGCGVHRIQEGLPTLVAWLRAHGCTDFRYQLSDAPQDT